MVKIGADVNGAIDGVNRVDNSVKGMSSSMRRGMLAAGAGVATGIGLAVHAAANFESSLNTFKAVSGATGEMMDQVSAKAVALGADMTLPGTSAADAADAMTELAKGGLSVKESMDAAKGVLQLSAAAQIDNATAATITARALNSFGLKGRDAVKVADQLAAASNASTAEISDLALGMSMASAVFKMGRQPIDTLTTSLGLMANAGITGSDAGTSLKTMMLRLQAPTNKAADALDAMGIRLRDSHGHMLPLRNLIGQFTRKTHEMTDAQRDAAFSTIFGTDAIRAANIVMAGGTSAYDKMHTAVQRHGAAADLAGAKMKGLNGAIEAAKSAAETAAIIFGSMLVGPLTVLAQVLSTVFGVMGQFNSVFAPVMAVLGTLMTEILLVVGAVKLWTIAQAMLNVVMAANPIVLIVAALVALAAGLIVAYQHCEAFRNIVNSAFESIRSVAMPVVEWLRARIPAAWAAILAATTSAYNSIRSIVTSVWNEIRSVVMAVLAVIVAIVRQQLNIISNIVKVVMALIRGDWSAAWNALKGLASAALLGAVAIIKSILTALVPAVLALALRAGKAIVTGIAQGLANLAMTLVTHLKGVLMDGLSSAASLAFNLAVSIGRSIVSGALSGLGGLAGAIKNKVESGLKSALSGLNPFSPVEHGGWKYIGAPLAQGAIDGWVQVSDPLPDLIERTVENAATTVAKNGKAKMYAAGQILATSVGDGFTSKQDYSILHPFKEAKYETDAWASSEGVDNMRGVGAQLADAIAQGVANRNELKETMKALAIGPANVSATVGAETLRGGGVMAGGGSVVSEIVDNRPIVVQLGDEVIARANRRDLIRTSRRNGTDPITAQ